MPSATVESEADRLLQPHHDADERRTESPQTRQGRKALYGFYAYSWAIEVYAVVSLTLFLPVTLEQYAREAGKTATEHTVPCLEEPLAVCEVSLFGWWLNTASFSLYTYSASVALQALTVIAISKAANDPGQRKRLLALFTLLGGTSCLLFLLIQSRSPLWPAAAILTILGNVSFGAAFVCLNAYLPTLARNTMNASLEGSDSDGIGPYDLSALTSQISSRGIGAGYAAGIALLLLMLIPVTLMGANLLSMRLAIAASGIWWLAFSIPAFLWLPKQAHDCDQADKAATSLSQPWRELWHILLDYRRIPETFKYLAAWFLMSDAFATITSTAILFAKTTLNMPASTLIFIGVLTPIFGIFGAVTWPWLQLHCLRGSSNLITLRVIVALAVLIPVYGLVALKTPVELLALSCYFGFLYGALQSYSRAVYAGLIPLHEEARFFALYSITDKSSSFIGPAIIAGIANATGSIRLGFVFLLVALLLPIPILGRVDVEKGETDAGQYVQ